MVGKIFDMVMGDLFKIIEDSAVMQEVITIIKEAREEIVLVSPYNDYHINLKNPLKAAAGDVHVIAICREDQKSKEDTHLKWLRELPADVYLVERLHAKIYCNESTALITSMNLSESSANNSREIGIRIKDAERIAEIRRYVDEGLIRHGKPFAAKPKPSTVRSSKAKPSRAPMPGHCIRCGEEIPYRPSKPMCFKHYTSWKRYHNPEYPQKYCHHCGEERKTASGKPISFNQPLCGCCYQKMGSAK